MPKSRLRIASVCVIVILLSLLAIKLIVKPVGLATDLSASSPAGPSTVPATSPTNDIEQLNKADKDRSDAMTELRKYAHTTTDLLDPAKIQTLAPQVVPLLRRIREDLVILSQVDGEAKYAVIQWQAFLVVWGDEQTTAELKRTAAENSDVSQAAKCSILLTAWWNSSKDSAAQTKVVADFQKLVQANNTEMMCVTTAMCMLDQGAASADQTDAVLKILTEDIKSPMGQQEVAEYKAEKQADAKLAGLENKPMTISGKQVDGKSFSTDSWKGKVILVDFWATWCAPCVEELPRVSKVYSDYHAKGLEIIGVSNDYVPEQLTGFLTDHQDVAWMQLFDPAAAANEKWNPLAETFGVTMLPEMFLIDKKGICRSVKAGDNLEDLIPKLLAE